MKENKGKQGRESYRNPSDNRTTVAGHRKSTRHRLPATVINPPPSLSPRSLLSHRLSLHLPFTSSPHRHQTMVVVDRFN
ncbi:hypothetical protein HanPSC8_Chr06g0264801 [Helianthus annuus]|nr:hypothetical protein HanPSC8_Chr06g0264801 [Helianthus annuus]